MTRTNEPLLRPQTLAPPPWERPWRQQQLLPMLQPLQARKATPATSVRCTLPRQPGPSLARACFEFTELLPLPQLCHHLLPMPVPSCNLKANNNAWCRSRSTLWRRCGSIMTGPRTAKPWPRTRP